MKRHRLPAALLLCGVLFMGCEKELAVEEAPAYGVRYQITTSNPNMILGTLPAAITNAGARTATAVSWASGSALAKRIRFHGSGNEEIDLRIATPTSINMMGPATTLGELAIPPGEYENARFTIELSTSQPFQLTGDYNGTPLKLLISDPLTFEVSRPLLSVSAQTNYDALTTLNLSRLLNGIDAAQMADAQVTNGQVLISSTSNQRLYYTILSNMKTLGDFDFARR